MPYDSEKNWKMETKYYKAIYSQDDGSHMCEVFVESSMDRAREYASGDNARGRQLLSLTEYPDQYTALTSEPDSLI
jgi:hypothetical protein